MSEIEPYKTVILFGSQRFFDLFSRGFCEPNKIKYMLKKIIFALFIMVMGVQTISAEEGHKDPSLQLTGFVPQKQKRNLSPGELKTYASGQVKPSIDPSNKFWSTRWRDYAYHLKLQIIHGVRSVTTESLTDEQAFDLFFKQAVQQKVVDSVLSTGIAYKKATGEVIGKGWTRKRTPYPTIDGGEKMLVFSGPLGDFKISLVCGNSFEIKAKPQPPVVIKPEPKVPVFCNETQKYPVFCDQQGTGNSSGVIATTVKPGGTPVPQSGAGRIETTVPVKQYTTSTGKVLVPGR